MKATFGENNKYINVSMDATTVASALGMLKVYEGRWLVGGTWSFEAETITV